MIHVAGLAAIVAVPAVLLYKLFSKMSGSGLPEGRNPDSAASFQNGRVLRLSVLWVFAP